MMNSGHSRGTQTVLDKNIERNSEIQKQVVENEFANNMNNLFRTQSDLYQTAEFRTGLKGFGSSSGLVRRKLNQINRDYNKSVVNLKNWRSLTLAKIQQDAEYNSALLEQQKQKEEAASYGFWDGFADFLLVGVTAGLAVLTGGASAVVSAAIGAGVGLAGATAKALADQKSRSYLNETPQPYTPLNLPLQTSTPLIAAPNQLPIIAPRQATQFGSQDFSNNQFN